MRRLIFTRRPRAWWLDHAVAIGAAIGAGVGAAIGAAAAWLSLLS